MYIQLTSFLNKNKVLSSFQFGFRNKHSTNHALISLTETIRLALDNDQFTRGVFIELQKTFDTADHKPLLSKMNHYGIKGIPYLTNRQHFTIANNKQSELSSIDFGVHQGSILGLLLFLIYINDLSKAIIFSSVHHLADDTNILYVSSSLKDINKKIKHDLSNLVQWLKTNKISLNVSKTEIKSHSKQITKHINFRLDGQKITPKNHTEYLGIIIDEHLTFREYMVQLIQKLNRTNGLLAKLRDQVSSSLLKKIYFPLFHSHLCYAAQVWSQGSNNVVDMVKRTQNKALQIINSKDRTGPSDLLYANHNILKLQNIIILNNCLFIYDQLCDCFKLFQTS